MELNMNVSRRLFGLQAVQLVATPSAVLFPAATVSMAVTAIVLPGRAHAIAPFTLGAVVATGLYELLTGFGLTKQMLSAIRTASARRVAKANDFDGSFADDEQLDVSQAWRFENGVIVGVNGSSFSGDPNAARRASLNVTELACLTHRETMKGWGSMVPTSTRRPPHSVLPKLVDFYKDAHAELQRSRTRRIGDPEYVRRFQKMASGDRVAGVFGRADNGDLRVTWVDEKELG
jgi:hypothetical protein